MGISHIADAASDKFDMVLSRDNKEFNNLPGIYVLIGGLWVANLYYWGFNQYIIQRTLAAKSLTEAQRGIAFAAFLKMLIPFIVVIPGIVAWVMYSEDLYGARSAFEIAGSTALNNDNAYPWLISTFIPVGVKGLVLAALAAAIVSSLASMLNSTSTIFTMDIYKPYINREASQTKTGQRRPFNSRYRLDHSRMSGPAIGRYRSDVPIHSGVYRFGKPGYFGCILNGIVLEESNEQRSDLGCTLFHSNRSDL